MCSSGEKTLTAIRFSRKHRNYSRSELPEYKVLSLLLVMVIVLHCCCYFCKAQAMYQLEWAFEYYHSINAECTATVTTKNTRLIELSSVSIDTFERRARVDTCDLFKESLWFWTDLHFWTLSVPLLIPCFD